MQKKWAKGAMPRLMLILHGCDKRKAAKKEANEKEPVLEFDGPPALGLFPGIN
jgi:hypothetical protein